MQDGPIIHWSEYSRQNYFSEHGYCNSEHDNEAVQDDLEGDASTFAVIASYIMSHRALPIHELFIWVNYNDLTATSL